MKYNSAPTPPSPSSSVFPILVSHQQKYKFIFPHECILHLSSDAKLFFLIQIQLHLKRPLFSWIFLLDEFILGSFYFCHFEHHPCSFKPPLMSLCYLAMVECLMFASSSSPSVPLLRASSLLTFLLIPPTPPRSPDWCHLRLQAQAAGAANLPSSTRH